MNRVAFPLILVLAVCLLNCAHRSSPTTGTRQFEAYVINKHIDFGNRRVYRVVMVGPNDRMIYLDDERLFKEASIGDCVIVSHAVRTWEILSVVKCKPAIKEED